MQLLRNIVLVLALMVLVKGLWCLFAPGSLQKTVDWWTRIPRGLARQLGFLLIAIGFVLIGLAIRQMGNAVIGAVTVIGTVFVLDGLVYLHPPVLQAVAKPFGASGAKWLVRVFGVIAVAVAGVLLFAYFRG